MFNVVTLIEHLFGKCIDAYKKKSISASGRLLLSAYQTKSVTRSCGKEKQSSSPLKKEILQCKPASIKTSPILKRVGGDNLEIHDAEIWKQVGKSCWQLENSLRTEAPL